MLHRDLYPYRVLEIWIRCDGKIRVAEMELEPLIDILQAHMRSFLALLYSLAYLLGIYSGAIVGYAYVKDPVFSFNADSDFRICDAILRGKAAEAMLYGVLNKRLQY